MLYILECWAVNKKIEKRMSVTEMRMIGKTRENRIRNEYVSRSIGVAINRD